MNLDPNDEPSGHESEMPGDENMAEPAVNDETAKLCNKPEPQPQPATVIGRSNHDLPELPENGSAWRRVKGKLLTRRAGLIALGLGGLSFLVGGRIQQHVSRVINPIVDDTALIIRDAFNFDVVSSDLSISIRGFGTFPVAEWEKAKADPSFYDKWYDSPTPEGFVPFDGLITGTLVADRGVFLKAVRFFEAEKREPIGSRRAISSLGGGDGDPLHAYVVINESSSIRYTQNGGAPQESVFFPISEDIDNPSRISVSILVVLPVVATVKVQLIFQRAGRQEFSKLEYGPLKVSGPPAEGSPELVLGPNAGEFDVRGYQDNMNNTLEALGIS